MKNELKYKAIKLRKKGLSYSEILKQIPVARSTLSLWLRSVGLSKRQIQRLTKKKWASIRRGWKAWSNKRIKRVAKLKRKALDDTKKLIINREKLWLMGLMLYWAEGAKAKNEDKGHLVIFSNSDPRMIQVFLKWLIKCLKIEKDQIVLELYIHKNHQRRLKEIIDHWTSFTRFPREKFDRIYYKKHNPKTLRTKIKSNYFGLVRVRVKKSTDLNRRIAVWIQGIVSKCGVV